MAAKKIDATEALAPLLAAIVEEARERGYQVTSIARAIGVLRGDINKTLAGQVCLDGADLMKLCDLMEYDRGMRERVAVAFMRSRLLTHPHWQVYTGALLHQLEKLPDDGAYRLLLDTYKAVAKNLNWPPP